MAIEKSRSNSRVAEKLTEDEMVIQKFRKLWSLAKIGSTQEQQLQLTRVNSALGGTQSCDVAIIGPGDRKEGQLFTFINNTMNRRGRYPIYPKSKRIQTFGSDK